MKNELAFEMKLLPIDLLVASIHSTLLHAFDTGYRMTSDENQHIQRQLMQSMNIDDDEDTPDTTSETSRVGSKRTHNQAFKDHVASLINDVDDDMNRIASKNNSSSKAVMKAVVVIVKSVEAASYEIMSL